MWYQMIRNYEGNNFVIENFFQKIIFIPVFVKFWKILIKNHHFKNWPLNKRKYGCYGNQNERINSDL